MMLAGFERHQMMKQSVRLTCTVLGLALMAAPNVFAGANTLSFHPPSQPETKFTVRSIHRSSQSGPQFTVRKFEKLTQPTPQFTVKEYQRPMRSQRRFVALQRRQSRTNRFKNNMPTNKQVRSGRNRHFKRPQRTKLARDPSLRSSGRQRAQVRRRSRWSANR